MRTKVTLLKRNALRVAVTGAAAVGLATVMAAPALATHAHHLETPGNACVNKGGAGFGTGETHDHSSFHARVHKGKPGLFAFERPNNPVSVVGFSTC